MNTSGGTPRIQLRVGGGDPEHLKWADYTSGNGNEALVFAYTVQAGDQDDNGIYIAADDLVLNGGTIQSAQGTDAELAYTQPGTQSGHKVDGVGPTPEAAWISLDGASIIILFSEPLAATTAPASAFTLAVDTGTASVVSSATASGNSVTLGLDSALTADQVVSVMYVDATSSNDSAAVQDAVGNDAADFTQTIENTVPQPVPSNWGLLPGGLGAGDHFRLIFVSSGTRNAQPTDIADYNTFVQTAAAAGHTDIQGHSSNFRVVGSTAAVDARDNTATRYTGDDTATTNDDGDLGVPIYWLGGNKVADEYRDFYDEDWEDEANAKDESGNDRSTSGGNRPFTGSDHDGTEAFDNSNASRALGADFVQLGVPNDASGGPLSFGGADSKTDSHPLYGLSPVFRVEGQTTSTNAAPEFSADTDVRTVPENSPAGTSIGDPVTATDADGDTLTYTLEGDDALSFGIDSSSGQIQTIAGVTYDHEAKSSYSVTVKADDSNGGTDTIIISIGLTDVDEPPAAPGAPAVSPVSGSSDSLDVSWSAPDNSGKPDIESYDLQYRQGTSSWTDGPQDVTVPEAIISGLAAGTEYQVRVRATNDEGDSVWSASGTGSTNAQAQAPTVSSVAVTSNPGADETYAIGDTIQVTVTFDAAVTVNTSGGTPRIQLRVGGGDPEHLKWADYSSGNEALVFAYTVQAGDEDTNGIFIAENELELNGGTIQSADGTDAVLAYTQPGTQSGHKVDGVGPTPEAAWTSLDGASIIILFSEPLAATTAPASAFTLAVDTGTTPVVTSATASGNSVTLGLDSALTADQVVSVMYVDVTSSNDSAAVQDAAGNDAANFTQTISNTVPQPVPSNWGLIPSGLGAGDRFRLVFLSSTSRDGSSTNIADYNTFVQTAAAVGHTDIQGSSSTFRVVGSTAAVDARDNTATRYRGDDTAATDDDGDLGVAIYWLDGAKVADEYRDFYDGDWDDEANAKDESGNDRSTSGNLDWPFTGSDHDGTVAFSGSISKGLGADLVEEGRPNSSSSGHGPLSSDGSAGKSNARPFYGLSAVFVVSADATTNAAPVFTSADNFSAAENQTAVGTVMATDADAGDTVTYAITGGDDQARFQIGSSTGLLVFDTKPDHESPTDADTNNVYQVTVTATGGTGAREMTATQDIAVTVNDVDEEPAITLVSVVSDPGADNTYGLGDTIEVQVTFDQAVTVNTSGGAPSIEFEVGGNQPEHLKLATYADGSGTATLRFDYVVQSGDMDDNGIWLKGDKLELNGGTIQGDDDNVAANLSYSSLGRQDDHKVDGSLTLDTTPPALESATVSEDGTIITLVFDEELGIVGFVGVIPTHFPVTADGSSVTVGTLLLVTEDVGGGVFVSKAIQLQNLSPAITHGQTVTVSYNDPTTGDDTSAVLEDAAGNDVATFTTGLGSVPAVVNNVPAAPTPVPTTWSLVPSGLVDGDSFRLLFIGSSGRDASDSDIAVYNTFIQNLVDTNGHDDIKAHSATFRMLGSTEAVDARDNTGTTGTGVPIYWLNGAKVADDYADFYDGGWDEEATGRRETGASVSIGSNWKIWTGSAEDGTEWMHTDGTSRALGNAGNQWVMQGSPNSSNSAYGPIESETANRNTDRGLYGLSGVFTVDASLDPVNTPPTFQQENTTREVEENSPAGTDVGDPVTATDADDDTLTYTLEGTDAASFQIVSTSGQIQTKSGITYDYETKEEYAVTVRADDGKGGTDTIAVAIDLLDVDETAPPPGAPQNVEATAGTGKVRLTWDAPESEGGGAVTHYEYRRKEGSGSFGSWTTAETVAFGSNSNSAILVDATTLDDYAVKAETTYTYRVRAVNASGGGDASVEDSATTGAAMTVKVEVAEPEVFEDEGPVRVVVVAELPATGPNMEKYELEFRVLALTSTVTASGPDYGGLNEFPVFEPDDFRMESGRWIAEKPYTVTLIDDDIVEPDETFRAEVHGGGAGTRHPFVTIPGATDTVTVTIVNDDHKPVVPTEQFDVLLGETDAGRLPARDEDGDTLTWTLTGGADQALFTLSSDGQLSLMTARTSLENPGDNNNDRVYELTVQVSDGHHTPATSGDITVRLIDVAEPPRRPGAPWVRALDGSTDALDVRWAEIEGDAVRSYDLRYREGSSGGWTNGPQDVTGIRDIIDNLESGTSYQVQLRATNSKGDSDWSPWTSAGTGTDNDVDAIYAYWTKTLGSEELHEDIAVIDGGGQYPLDQSSMLVNACNTTESFRMYWAPDRVADEWEAEAFTDGGASNVSINDVHYTNRDRLLPELTGTARLNGLSRVLVRVRGRFGEDWANWSRVAEVMCLPPESGDGQTGQQNVEEDEDEESTAPLTARFLYEEPLGYHSGAGTTLTVRLSFSETVSITPEALGQALALTNATAEAVSRVDDRSDLWEVRLTPHSDGMVTLLLPLAADCDAAGAVCTGDGKMLSIGVGTVIPGPPPNSQATGAPTIDGVAEVGQVLSADVTGIDDDNAEFSYQWLRSDGDAYTEIEDATGSTYTLVAADQGKTVKVKVSFTDDEGNPETLTSDPTGEVEAAETVPGRPQDLEGEASAQGIALTWNAPVDSTVTSYVIYRAVLDQGQLHGKPMTKHATIDATGAEMAYFDADAEAGVEYRYRVAAVNSAGEGKKSTWINIFAEDS